MLYIAIILLHDNNENAIVVTAHIRQLRFILADFAGQKCIIFK